MSDHPTCSVDKAAPAEGTADIAHGRRFAARTWAPYLFISPFFILFAVFGLFPLLFSFYVSLHAWDPASGLQGMRWVGWENYLWVLARDDWFHKAIRNTVWIGLASGLPQHLVALPLAFLLETGFRRFRTTMMGIYFLPFITSTVAISLVFTTLFSREFGVVNAALQACAGLPVVGWLFPAQPIDWTQPEYTRAMISFVVWWRYVGFNTVLYLSAMQTLPKALYEAATLDGATRWQQFRYITLPQLKPMIYFAVTLTVIGSLQLFEEPYILTAATGGDGRLAGSGGIDQAGKTVAMHMYYTGFSESDFGTASAIAWLLFLLTAAMTWIHHRLLGNKESETV